MMSIGWKMSWNCGTPRSNSSWNVDSAMSMPPGRHDAAQALDPPHLVVERAVALHRADDLDLQDGDGEQRHRGAADEHEVRRAPERDVLAEEPVPLVVEREAEQREAAARRT